MSVNSQITVNTVSYVVVPRTHGSELVKCEIQIILYKPLPELVEEEQFLVSAGYAFQVAESNFDLDDYKQSVILEPSHRENREEHALFLSKLIRVGWQNLGMEGSEAPTVWEEAQRLEREYWAQRTLV
jgi:hypothetical protein